MRSPHDHFFPNNEQYRNRIFAKARAANDNEYRVNKAQQVKRPDATQLTEFEWARQTSKTWDMGQD